jgi:hypothetical protein
MAVEITLGQSGFNSDLGSGRSAVAVPDEHGLSGMDIVFPYFFVLFLALAHLYPLFLQMIFQYFFIHIHKQCHRFPQKSAFIFYKRFFTQISG